jgi:hypothetical protein
VPCAAGYAWGEDGSNQCPTSYFAIVNAAACETAAAAAGKAYRGSETDPSYPSGCYFHQDFGAFFFNTDAVGDGYPGTQLMCSGAGRVSPGRLRYRAASMIAARWDTHGLLWGHSSIPHRGSRRRSNAAHGWMRTASVPGLERCCEGVEGVLWVLHRPPGVLMGYYRRAPLRACMVNRTRLRAALVCGQREHMVRVLRDSEIGCSHLDHPSANRHPDHPVNICAGRCSPAAAAVGQRTRPALDRLRPTRPRRFRAASPWQAPLTVHAVQHVQAARCQLL